MLHSTNPKHNSELKKYNRNCYWLPSKAVSVPASLISNKKNSCTPAVNNKTCQTKQSKGLYTCSTVVRSEFNFSMHQSAAVSQTNGYNNMDLAKFNENRSWMPTNATNVFNGSIPNKICGYEPFDNKNNNKTKRTKSIGSNENRLVSHVTPFGPIKVEKFQRKCLW